MLEGVRGHHDQVRQLAGLDGAEVVAHAAERGRVPGGDASAKDLKGWSRHAAKNSYARGGRLPTAGQDSGEGRLQLTKLQKAKRGK